MLLLNSFIAKIWMTCFAKWEGKTVKSNIFLSVVTCGERKERIQGSMTYLSQIRCFTIIYVRKEMRPTLRYFRIFDSLELNILAEIINYILHTLES